jgi:DNA modification methylase
MKKTKLMLGDNIESLKKLPDNSVDSVVTDPPYGLSFMGKKWDYDVPSVEFWKEVYRVLKPGGHVLSFGGTRTYHRMVVNIEDAGFEIRDQIQWIYGSGFPKSHNIGVAVDKLEGNDREIIGERKAEVFDNPILKKQGSMMGSPEGRIMGDIKITKGSSQYEGWGTALKPAQEIVAVAQKPENLEGTALNLIYNIKKELWKLYVKIVESSSELNQVEQREVLNTAQCLVEKNINIQDALQGLMDMSQLRLMENMNWSIVLLWHNILEDLYQKMSKYTTSTKLNLTIDVKTLKSLEWQSILESITQVKDNQIDGLNVNALTAVVLFNALNLKLKDIHQHSVEDNVIYKEDKKDCLNNPICVARKPLSEKSVAENVLKWGTGGINVDGCRVGLQDGEDTSRKLSGANDGIFNSSKVVGSVDDKWKEGRFPANIILECICDDSISHDDPNCPCRLLDEQSGESKSNKGVGNRKPSKNDIIKWSNTFENGLDEGYNDKGGASRFFYQAKVSKAERNMGLDGFEDKKFDLNRVSFGTLEERYNLKSKNNHPTVKPINLMAYLCRLITPEGGIVLDPFMGSGSTGISAQLEGFRFVGMEMDPEYFKIAEARISSYEKYEKFKK